MERTIGIVARAARGTVRAALLLGLLASMATDSRAATIVPPANLSDLGRRSAAVVLATAVSAEPVQRGPLIFTSTRFLVTEALSGPVSNGEGMLVEAPGGEIGGQGWLVAGSPRFEAGATYLLFLSPGRNGRWQPTVMSWGVMRRVETETLGNVLVPLEEGGRISALPRLDGLVPEALVPMLEGPLVAHLSAVIEGREGWNAAAIAAPRSLLPGNGTVDTLAVPSGCSFMAGSGGKLRRKTFDTGGSVTMSSALPGDSLLGGFSEVQGALDAWEGVSGTSINLTYGGEVAYTLPCTGGQDMPDSTHSVVVFNDPCSDIANLSGCSGTLGFGGPWYKGTHTFDGTTWMTITSWFEVVNNGAGCLGSTNFQIMLAHELGHGLGFDHVTDSSALMYSMCCNNINSTDRTCAQYVYPGSDPPPAPAPVASFTFSPARPVVGQMVSFTDNSTNTPTSWSWDFGDGTFSAAQHPTKIYAFAATLTVRLTATNAFGSSATTRSITIATTANRPPVAGADSYTVTAGTVLTVNPPGVLGNDSDPDGDAMTAVLASPPGGDALGLQPSGAFVYTPTAGFIGSDTFLYRAVDARGAQSEPALVLITVPGAESERVVPVVLDAFGVGTSRFRSELVLANRGKSTATVELTYTAASSLNASGNGTVNETLAPGRQLVLDDALAYLRSRGLPIPLAVVGASQGGTLRVRFRNLSSADSGAAFARTTALLPEGRAGVAYPALAPADWTTVPAQRVFGLRETGQERSNLAMANLGSTGDLELRVTLYSGSRSDPGTYVLPETIWLRPLQWTQLGSVLSRAGFTNGWALVERVAGSEPFYAYGVFNDYGTNDGSFIDPIPAASTETSRTVPVVLELGIYTTELILTNPTGSDVAVSLRYVESSSAAGVARTVASDFLRSHEQKVLDAIPYLRGLGVDIGPTGGSYAGSLVATFAASGVPATGFAGARTKSPGASQGAYGVYYSGLGTGQLASSEAWIFGLKQDGESRTNVAIAHAERGGGALTLQAEIFNGETGASAGKTSAVTLGPGQWFQWNQILSGFGLNQGYARIFRVSGASPFLAYGVVNDGGSGRPGTNDGSYVQMLLGR